jgi:hypothetical protein
LENKEAAMKYGRVFAAAIFAAFVFMMFSSCFTFPKRSIGDPEIYDPSVPEEKTAVVFFQGFFFVMYNGIRTTSNYMAIPAGRAEISGNVHYYDGHLLRAKTEYTAEGARFTYNFQAGKEYLVKIVREEGRWTAEIYEAEKGEEDELLEVIPL